MKEKINAILMLEILGKPKEHIKKILNDIVKSLGKEEDVKLINKNIAEPKKLEQEDLKEDVFTSFAELEIETNLEKLMSVVFAYTPSHIDIIAPEDLKIKNSDLSLFLNGLVIRLHQYDELAKGLMIERQMIAEQIKEGKIVLSLKNNKKEGKKKSGKKTERAN